MKQERLIIIKNSFHPELDDKTIFPNQAADAFNDYFTQIINKLNTEHTDKDVSISCRDLFLHLSLKWYTFQLLI
jgi:hypothetical protein